MWSFFIGMPSKLSFGIDSFLLRETAVRNQRLALVTNNAAMDISGTLSRVALLNHHFNLISLFSPEHGITVKGTMACRSKAERMLLLDYR